MLPRMVPGVFASCREELTKIAASWSRFHAVKARSGKRPLKVSTLLKKEREGTLFKEAFDAGARGGGLTFPEAETTPGPAMPAHQAPGYVPSRDLQMLKDTDATLAGSLNLVPQGRLKRPPPMDPPSPKDLPTRSEVGNAVKREDSRDFATTIYAGNKTSLSDIGISTASFDRND